MITRYQSINLIREAMQACGYESTVVPIDGRTHAVFRKHSAIWITPTNYVQYPFVSSTLKALSKDKELSYEYVSELGFAVPVGQTVLAGEAFTLREQLQGRPLIVKPADGSGSRGVTLDISNKEQLDAALLKAFKYSPKVLVQERFKGEEIRLTILNGRVLSVLQRQTLQIIGDGVQTIAGLLAEENNQRSLLNFPYITYPRIDSTLITKPLALDAIPGRGERVELSRSTLVSGGASLNNINDTVHPSYKQIAQHIAGALEASFLVIDLLVNDYKIPAEPGNYVFLECNTAPALKMYYSFRTGKSVDIITELIDAIDECMHKTP